MAEINDTFRVPSDTTDFSDNDRLDFHMANPESSPYDATRFAAEAINLAASSDTHAEADTPEIHVADYNEIKFITAQIVEWRAFERDSHLNIFDEAA